MKLTVLELANGMNSGALRRACTDKWLPIDTFFELGPIWKVAQDFYNQFVASRDMVAERLKGETVTVNESFTKLVFPTPAIEAQFNEEVAPLLNKVIEIPGRRFTRADFKPRPLTAGEFLSGDDLLVLQWLIDDGVTVREDPDDQPLLEGLE